VNDRSVASLTTAERLNFLLTNRLPRRWLTLAIGRFSRIENPLIKHLSIGLWRLFVDDLRLYEAKKSTFDSLHDCFTRELKDGARPVDLDPEHVVSPCDAIVGECGAIDGRTVFQAKGFPYDLSDLLLDEERASRFVDGTYVTLRLKSSMYHHLHAPLDARVEHIDYVSGDTWNVNPVALKIVERLFCKNERAIIDLDVERGNITLVPIAAILVASMRFVGLESPLNLEYAGPNRLSLSKDFSKGERMGHFEHGSTVVVFASRGYRLCDSVKTGDTIRVGQPLLIRPAAD